MNFFIASPKEAKPQTSSSSPQKSEFPNPFFSFFDNLLHKKKKKNLSLTNAEIRKRLVGTHVYTLSDSPGRRYCMRSHAAERDLEVYFFSKPDAEEFLHEVQPTIQVEPSTQFQLQLRGVPLNQLKEKKTLGQWMFLMFCGMFLFLGLFKICATGWFGYAIDRLGNNQVVDYEGEGPTIRLVPEISEINNAVQEREKNVGSPDEKFSGVPVFQADDIELRLRLRLRKTGDPNEYRPAYFRKDDLEKTLSEIKGFSHTNKEIEIIQVAALEDIIQEMKDPSTEKSNDIYFIAPGTTYPFEDED